MTGNSGKAEEEEEEEEEEALNRERRKEIERRGGGCKITHNTLHVSIYMYTCTQR